MVELLEGTGGGVRKKRYILSKEEKIIRKKIKININN